MYSVTDLGTLGGSTSRAFGINNLGEVVGDADMAGDTISHAYLYDQSGKMIDLGTLGGTFSEASAVNDLGQVVGVADTAAGPSHAFLYSNGTMQDLGTLGGPNSWATGINNQGRIVGTSYVTGSPSNQAGFVCGGGGPLTSTGAEFGRAINNNGDIAGAIAAGQGAGHAYLLPAGGSPIDVGTLGGATSEGVALNDNGWVVGQSLDGGGGERGFAYTGTAMFGLSEPGELDGMAEAVNDQDSVVGYYDDQGDNAHAFV